MTMTEARLVDDRPVVLEGAFQGEAALLAGHGLAQTPGQARALDAQPGERPAPVGHESHARTIVKSLTWRAGGLMMTVGVAWWITGKGELAASIGLADTVIKIVVYYVHERMWLKIPFGRDRKPEYEI